MEEQQQKRSGLIHGDSDHIAVEGHLGTWHAVDETEVGGEKFSSCWNMRNTAIWRLVLQSMSRRRWW